MKVFRVVIFLVLAGLTWLAYEKLYKKPAFIIGEKIPSFQAELLNGKSFSSDQLMGKLTLLDFWGSWCGPCRTQNPELARLYKKYSDTLQGYFQIVSIAFDDDTTQLNKAILSDSLIWPDHIRESKMNEGPIGRLFKIREIPTTYLVNDQMRILRVNPSIQELEGILQKTLEVATKDLKKGQDSER